MKALASRGEIDRVTSLSQPPRFDLLGIILGVFPCVQPGRKEKK
jgi:hypothetical protein